jgi:hypothetical protein
MTSSPNSQLPVLPSSLRLVVKKMRLCESCKKQIGNLKKHNNSKRHAENLRLKEQYGDAFDIEQGTVSLPCGIRVTRKYLKHHLETKVHRENKCILRKRGKAETLSSSPNVSASPQLTEKAKGAEKEGDEEKK